MFPQKPEPCTLELPQLCRNSLEVELWQPHVCTPEYLTSTQVRFWRSLCDTDMFGSTSEFITQKNFDGCSFGCWRKTSAFIERQTDRQHTCCFRFICTSIRCIWQFLSSESFATKTEQLLKSSTCLVFVEEITPHDVDDDLVVTV